MERDELSVMSAFLAVADERSFTEAAKRLGVTQSALSHAIRGLEEQIGVRLLARTTRSAAPTEGAKSCWLICGRRSAIFGGRWTTFSLFVTGRPDACACWCRHLQRQPFSHRSSDNLPATIRTSCSDVTTDESRVDLVAAGFDAGIHFGEFIERDMVAV